MSGRGVVRAFSLLGQQPTPNADQPETQLGQDWHRRERPGYGYVESLSKARILAHILCPTCNNLDSVEVELCARVDQECSLVLVRLDEGQLEVGPDDLQRDAREASTRTHVDDRARIAEMVGKDEAVLD